MIEGLTDRRTLGRYSARVARLCALLLTAAVAHACSDTPVEPHAPVGTILYWVYERGGKSDIYALDLGATTPRRLTFTESAYEAHWSRDGRWIVYLNVVTAPNGQKVTQVFVMRADGSGARQVTTSDTGLTETPAISPDGRLVAYACGRRAIPIDYRICLIRTDGGTSTLITPSTLGTDPSWSPDGALIAFACLVGTPAARVCVMKPDGSELRPISPDSINVNTLEWSPDGSQFAISAVPTGSLPPNMLYIMSANGSEVRRVINEQSPTEGRDMPSWSPDLAQLAFVRYRPDGAKLYVVNEDGTGERPLLADTKLQWNPSWSPTPGR